MDSIRKRWAQRAAPSPSLWAVYTAIIILSTVHLGVLLMELGRDFSAASIFGISGTALAQGQIYRLVTGVFVHMGLMHLLMNMLVLYMLGRVVEALAGPRKFFAVFVIAGLTGSAFSVYLNPPHILSVGASGAIMGYLGYILASKVLDPRSVPQAISQWATSLLLINVAWNVFSPGGLDVWGHIGGFVGGGLAAGILGFPYWRTLARRRRQEDGRYWLPLVSSLLLLLIWWAPLTMLPNGTNPWNAVGASVRQISGQWERQQFSRPGRLGPWAWDTNSYAQMVSPAGLYQFFWEYAETADIPDGERMGIWQQWQELGRDRQVVLVHLYVSEYSPEMTDLRTGAVGMGRAYLENSEGVIVEAEEQAHFPVNMDEEPFYGLNLLSFPRTNGNAELLQDDTRWIRLEVWTGRGDLSVQFAL